MATVVYAARALEDLQRAFEFLAATDPAAAGSAATAIQSAVASLAAHPLIGRRIHGEIRELVISFGKSGYVALYRFLPHLDLAAFSLFALSASWTTPSSRILPPG